MAEQTPQERMEEFMESMAKIGQRYPEVAGSFMNLVGAVMQDGALGAKEKELISLGIAVGLRCIPCITAHTQAAIGHGATDEEILDAAMVAVIMQGGPGMAYVAEVMKTLEGFRQKT